MLVLAAAMGALLAGTALAQPGPVESGDAQLAEVVEPCYVAPAEADRTTVALVANEACDASEAATRGVEPHAGGDDAAAAHRVGSVSILP